MPLRSTAHYLPLPKKDLGLDIILPSMLSDLCQTNTSLILIKSNDPKMNKLNQLNGFCRSDLRFDISKSKNEVITDLKKRQLASEAEELDILKIQSILMRALKAALTSKELVSWSDHVSLIPLQFRFLLEKR